MLLAAYVATGKLSLLLALPPGYASAIFPPAGLAVGAAFVARSSALGWVFLGSLLLNAWIGHSAAHAFSATVMLSATAIAAASTLQAGLGAWGLRRVIGYPAGFDKAGELVGFLVLCPIICLVSASLSVGYLTASGTLAAADLVTNWFTWWIGDSLGLIVVFPVLLTIIGEPRSLWRGRLTLVALPMVLVLALVVLAFVKATEREFDESMRDFDTQSQSLYRQFQARFEEQELLLEEIAAFFPQVSGPPVTRAEFHRIAANSLVHYPMVLAVEWAPRIAEADRARFEAGEQRDFPGFRIRERDAARRLAVAPRHDAYFPLLYLEPFAPNAAALGFDLYSNEKRRSAVDRSWQSQRPAATPPVHLAQDADGLTGILLVLKSNNGAQAPGALLTALRVRDFVEQTLPADHSAYRLCLADTATQEALYGNADCNGGGPRFARTLTFGGRQYAMVTTPSALYLAHHRGWESWAALVVALFGTGVLGAFLLLAAGARSRREHEERLALSLVGSDVALADWDLVHDRLVFGVGWTSALGYAPDQLPRNPAEATALVHPDDAPPFRALLVSHLKGATTMLEAEIRMRHRDGHWVWMLARGMAVARDDQGRALRVTGTAKDVTESKALQETIYDNAAQIADLYDRAPCGYHSLSPEGIFVRINATELEWLGRRRDDVAGKLGMTDMLTPESAVRFAALFERLKQTGTLEGTEFDLAGSGCEVRRVSIRATAIYHPDGTFRMSRGVMYDVTELSRVRNDLQRLTVEQNVMLDNDMVGIVKLRNREAVWANRAMHRIFGYAPGELIGLPSRVLYPDDDACRALGDAAYPVLSAGRTFRRQVTMVRKDGEPVWIDVSGVQLSWETGESMWTMIDVTVLKRQQEQIEHLAFHDLLTDLPNRLLLADRVRQALGSAERSRLKVAICYLDLDGFKPVNDRYGHEAGDRLLRELAVRLQDGVRANDTVCRIGGDEFVLVIVELKDTREFETVAERILAAVNRPFRVDAATEVTVSASIGAALFPDDAREKDELLRLADLAMYRAKAAGRNRLVRHGGGAAREVASR